MKSATKFKKAPTRGGQLVTNMKDIKVGGGNSMGTGFVTSNKSSYTQGVGTGQKAGGGMKKPPRKRSY